MGNHISYRLSNPGKVILPDGVVLEFDQPLTVAELMLEYPQQVVIEFGSFKFGNRPTPLPADKKLDSEKVYFMLPMKRGKVTPLSVDEARRILLKVKPVMRYGSLLSSARILPFFAQVCRLVGIGAGDGGLSQGKEGGLVEKLEKGDRVKFQPEIFDERSEFFSRELSSKGWKPTLETIKEKGVEKKVPHWLF